MCRAQFDTLLLFSPRTQHTVRQCTRVEKNVYLRPPSDDDISITSPPWKQRATNASSKGPIKPIRVPAFELHVDGSLAFTALMSRAELPSESRVENEDLIMVIIVRKILPRRTEA